MIYGSACNSLKKHRPKLRLLFSSSIQAFAKNKTEKNKNFSFSFEIDYDSHEMSYEFACNGFPMNQVICVTIHFFDA